MKDKREENFELVKKIMVELTDEQRLEIFAEYCTECGCDDSGCQCWNDE